MACLGDGNYFVVSLFVESTMSSEKKHIYYVLNREDGELIEIIVGNFATNNKIVIFPDAYDCRTSWQSDKSSMDVIFLLLKRLIKNPADTSDLERVGLTIEQFQNNQPFHKAMIDALLEKDSLIEKNTLLI